MPAVVRLVGEPLGGLPGGGERVQLLVPAHGVAVLCAHAWSDNAGRLEAEAGWVAHDPPAGRARIGACRAVAVPCAAGARRGG